MGVYEGLDAGCGQTDLLLPGQLIAISRTSRQRPSPSLRSHDYSYMRPDCHAVRVSTRPRDPSAFWETLNFPNRRQRQPSGKRVNFNPFAAFGAGTEYRIFSSALELSIPNLFVGLRSCGQRGEK